MLFLTRPLRAVILAIACVGPVGFVQAAPPAAAASCGACHGARGEGNATLGAPAIAGQHAAYLERQLQAFRSGTRGAANDRYGAQMRGAVAALRTEADLKAAAAYYAGLPATRPAQKAGGDLRNGQTRYLGNCGACHGAKAEGNPAFGAPRLAGHDAAYLKRQFQAFQKGTRGTQPQDRYGKQMRMMAGSLGSPKDLDDVIAFIHAQGAAR